MSYFVVSATVDGWGIGNPIKSKEALLKSLRAAEEDNDFMQFVYCDNLKDFDPECVRDGVVKKLIIKGEIVMPRPKVRVVEYDIE